MDVLQVKDVWEKVKQELISSVPDHVFYTWITPLEAVDFEHNTLVLLSPQQMSVNILKNSWSSAIKDAISKVVGENASFSLNYDAELGKKYIQAKKKQSAKIVTGQTDAQIRETEVKKSLAQMQSEANLNLNLKFENFVVGDNSKFAYNAALAVAKNPAQKFNPLFIYGASGLGKTHLLQAIGHYLLFNSKLKVRYVRMEEYFKEWIKCFQLNDVQSGKKKSCNETQMRKFRQKFQNIDILLMDDIQFIESRAKTMEDFFSTFEALHTNNKQIVIASDRQPKDIPSLSDRLRTRFEMGLVVDIVSPDYDTRIAIVKAYANELQVNAPDDVFEYIAQNFTDNVRELKGAFNKVSAFSEIFGEKINIETARKALKLEIKKRELTPELLANKVADYFGVSVKDLKGNARNQKVAKARQIALYLCREILKMSYESIGEFFNKKHSTVIYSCRDVVGEKIKTDTDLAKIIDEITLSLKD
ncbi:chromosomal replication initiator protein DnaA [bacterium]|nr:chromosomal replication initiator protein DnaA [bacterium]